MNLVRFSPSALPSFKHLNLTTIESTILQLIEKNKEKIEFCLHQPLPLTWDNLMQPMEEMADTLSELWSPIAHLHAVADSEALRGIYNRMIPILTDYYTALSQNEALYQATDAIAQSEAYPSLNIAQRKIIENDLRDFKLSGIHLPADKKEQLADLNKKLSQLMTTFSENVLDATQGFTLHITDEKELDGLPTHAIQLAIDNAKQRNLTGYVLTLDYPSYSTAIRFIKNRRIRKIMYEAYVTRASDVGPNAHKWDNTLIMEQILQVRHTIANLIGFKHFADYSLETKMATSPTQVISFLNELLTRSKPIAEKEFQAVVAIAKQLDGIEQIESWDVPYYSEKLQLAEFHFTQEDLRPYFPAPVVLQGLFTIVEKLYGIRVEHDPSIEVWHKDVMFFALYDEKNHLRGGCYMDLYARQNKRDGAWMDECRSRKYIDENTLQYPVAYLTCNFMPPTGSDPALLTHDDVLTLFHEFGHCLHHMLTKVDYPSVGGINGVAWDAVEFPSQFMENFCWEKASLDLLARHYQTNEPLPDDLYNKMIAAKNFQTGLQMVRQIEFALFDFYVHLEFDPSIKNQIQTILNRVREETAVMKAPAYNRFQHSFSHIFGGGYAAGYYSYKWAEVLSADAYAKFEENGIFDPATGRSFLENILEMGGVRDAMVSFIAFRGREPSIDALLRHSGIGS